MINLFVLVNHPVIGRYTQIILTKLILLSIKLLQIIIQIDYNILQIIYLI